MADRDEYSIKTTTLTSIANAIRIKKETTDPIAVSDFASEISTISGGGGLKTVTFPIISTTYTTT